MEMGLPCDRSLLSFFRQVLSPFWGSAEMRLQCPCGEQVGFQRLRSATRDYFDYFGATGGFVGEVQPDHISVLFYPATGPLLLGGGRRLLFNPYSFTGKFVESEFGPVLRGRFRMHSLVLLAGLTPLLIGAFLINQHALGSGLFPSLVLSFGTLAFTLFILDGVWLFGQAAREVTQHELESLLGAK